jgi:hypothetical protein
MVDIAMTVTPKISDLSLPDFFLWSRLKRRVRDNNTLNIEEIKTIISHDTLSGGTQFNEMGEKQPISTCTVTAGIVLLSCVFSVLQSEVAF